MTDRELLEAAAKAALLTFNNQYFDAQSGLLVWEPPQNYESRDWNPLTDDGDALRLAVKLRITVQQTPNYVVAVFITHRLEITEHEDNGSDPFAATRRAIVRAAAAIGDAK